MLSFRITPVHLPGGRIRQTLNNRKEHQHMPPGTMEFKFTLEGSFEPHKLFTDASYIKYKVFSQIIKLWMLSLWTYFLIVILRNGENLISNTYTSYYHYSYIRHVDIKNQNIFLDVVLLYLLDRNEIKIWLTCGSTITTYINTGSFFHKFSMRFY